MPKNPPNIFDWMPAGQRKKLLEQKPAMKPMEDAPERPPAQAQKMLPGQAKLPKQKQDLEFEYDQYLGIFVGVSHGHGQGHGPGGSHGQPSVGGGGGTPPPQPATYRIDVGTGVFTLPVASAGSHQNRVLHAGTGSFGLSGKDATLLYHQTPTHHVLGAGVGQFGLNGQAVTGTYTQTPPVVGQFALGVNLSGLDFSGQVSQTSTAPFYNINFMLAPTLADLDYWKARGCQRMRLPVRWEHIQPVLNGALEPTFLATVNGLIDGCVSRGMPVLLDIHSFGTWFGTAMGNGAVTIAAFVDLWSRLANQYVSIAGNALAFDLMNEPVGLPQGETTWVAFAKAAIAAIHAIDPDRPVYVEGYFYASTWSWLSNNPTLHTVRDAAPTHPIVISGHCYADHNNEGAYFDWDTEAATPGGAPPGTNTNLQILVQRTAAWRQWLVDHNYRGHIGEVGLPASWEAARPVNDINWQTTFQNLVNVCIPAGIEIDAWSAGPYWGSYPQSLSEYNGKQSRAVPTLQAYWGNNVQPTVYYADGPTRGLAGAESSIFTIDYRGLLSSPVVVTPHSSAGGTWTPATRTISGNNPTATFTLNIATEQVSQITFTNNGGLTNPSTRIYTTQVDDFATVESHLQNVFSFRRIVATYIGPCLRLRRSTDNAESDFNFTSNAMYAPLDTAAITTWAAGAPTLYLVTGYNQNVIINANHLVIPYTDSTQGVGSSADQPTFVVNDGDGFPSIYFDGTKRMDWESPLELVTGQVLITTANHTAVSPCLSWSFVSAESQWGPGWRLTNSPLGNTNIYNDTSERNYMANGWETGEWHVYSGSWTGGLLGVGNIKTWKDGNLVGIADSGATTITVDYHRNQMNVGYRRFGVDRWTGKLRTIIAINGPISDVLVNTIQARDVAYYGTAPQDLLPTADIDLNFAADTYTVDGVASSLAANVANSPTRDSNGLICNGSQTYLALGPLLTALQGSGYTVQVDTVNVTEGSAGGWAMMLFKNTAGTLYQRWGWLSVGGVMGTVMQTNAVSGFTEVYPNNNGYYLDDHGTGYRGKERRHSVAKTAAGYSMTQDGDGLNSLTVALPAWDIVAIGNWPGVVGHDLVGRIKRIRVWRSALNVNQQLLATENLRTKGSVPSTFKMGVNCAGGEFGGGIDGAFVAYPTAAEATYYAARGFKLMRVPFSWMRIQKTLNGPLDPTTLASLKTVVANNTAAGITTLLDLHNYNTYYRVSDGITYGMEDTVTNVLKTANGTDFWSKMAQVPEFNSSLVWFGLMNEPASDWQTRAQWFTTCSAWTAAIRAHNVVSRITVPTNYSATAASHWSEVSGAAFLTSYTDSANLSSIEVHQYFDSDGSGGSALAVQNTHIYFANVIRFCRENNKTFIVGETGWGEDTTVVQGPIEGDESMRLLRNADDVCLGFCYWAGGPAWSNYFQTIEPACWSDNENYADPRGDRTAMATLRKWIPAPYLVPAPASAYYVDTAGSDSNDGLSAATPWQTIAKVNASTFAAGTSVLFKGGQTFTGSLVTPSGGTIGNPVTYGSYGTGRATINGGNSYAIFTYNQEYVTIRDLIAVGNGITTNAGHAGILAGTDLPGGVKLAGISIINCDAHQFGARGIAIGGWVDTSGYTGALIQDCIAYDNAGIAGGNGSSGIIVYGQTAGSVSHTNITIRRCQAYGNTGTGTGAGGWTGSGIVIGQCSNSTIEYCVAHDNGINSATAAGPVGIWFWDCTGCTIQYCESYNNKTGSATDGGGFDIDGGCLSCTIQYCYSHGNMGPGYLMFKYAGLGWNDNTIRYCISENDGTAWAANPLASGIGIQSNSGALTNVKVYANTIYQNVAGGAACMALGGNQSSQGVIANNIFYTGSTSSNLLNAPQSQASMLFRGNNYYATNSFTIRWNGTPYGTLAAWRAASGQEIVSGSPVGFSVNPLLTSPGAGVTVNSTTAGALATGVTGYTQQPGTPMRNAGRNLLVEFGISSGSHDFYGHAAPYEGAYDIGAAEGG